VSGIIRFQIGRSRSDPLGHTSPFQCLRAIAVLLFLKPIGCGTASFDAPFSIYTSIASADLNGDGTLDIAMSGSRISGPPPHPGYSFVLLRDPADAARFLPPVRYEAGNDPDFLVVGDINGDGLKDLAVANYGSPDGSIKGSASIFLQDPATPGRFLPATEFATASRSASVAIGDLNGDGRLDLAVANPVSGGPGGTISILFQAPGSPGSFLPAANYPGIFQPLSVAIGDLNGDGNADIAVSDGGAVLYYQDPVRKGIFSGPVRIGP
jgi:hypothetical protein